MRSRRLRDSVATALLAVAPVLAVEPTGNAQGVSSGVDVLSGQVVCSQCWFDSDRDEKPYGVDEMIECASRCSDDGTPVALAVRDGSGVALYQLEPGLIELDDHLWQPWVGQFVEATGFVVERSRKRLFVDTLAVVAAPSPSTAPVAAERAGRAPDLTLATLAGEERSLSDLHGSTVVLNFWATWCLPCREEMPALVGVHRDYAERGVRVIGASVDAPEARDAVVEFTAEHTGELPIWVGAGPEHLEEFGVGMALPSTVIIDSEGYVVARLQGLLDDADLRRRLDALVR